MRISAVELENKIDKLLAHLEHDIEYLQSCLQYLDELRKNVVKRDEPALRDLLEVIQVESNSYKQHESARGVIRRELADYLGFGIGQVTLSALQKYLPENKQAQITASKTRLKALIYKLNKEYSSTMLLLSECSRFNSLVLKSIFAMAKTGGTTYCPKGTAKLQNDAAFVNLRL